MNNIDSLDQLVAFLNNSSDDIRSGVIDLSSLPTFGGKPPGDTLEIYSWDSSEVMFFNELEGRWDVILRSDARAWWNWNV